VIDEARHRLDDTSDVGFLLVGGDDDDDGSVVQHFQNTTVTEIFDDAVRAVLDSCRAGIITPKLPV